jgi:hypothetical protein
MTLKSYLYLVLAVANLSMLSGCKNQAYFFVSPFNGNNLEYHPIPKHGDSIHTAIYSSLTYSNGSANESGTDYLWSLHSSVHAAHQYDNVQFHYGLGLTLGSYTMGRWPVDTVPYPPAYPGPQYNNATAPAVQLNAYSGPHFFGGVGFQGGINGVTPFENGEWRYLGIETAVTQEFGNYLAVRKQLPDSIVTLLNRSPLFATVGITTELVGHTRQGEFGFKWALGYALGHSYSNPGVGDGNGNPLRYKYFNFTFHYTYRRFTSYLQINDATKASLVFLGVDYRLWAR